MSESDARAGKAPRRVLVTGADGRVGCALQRISWPADLIPVFTRRSQLDLCGAEDLRPILERTGAGLVINAAAWTDVDGAEGAAEAAWRVNLDGVARLAAAAADCGAALIHLSTDYVFGDGMGPRSEDDEIVPLGVYGASKRAGEVAALAANPQTTVLRTSWLFDGLSPNFLTAMAERASRASLEIVADQQGSPTLTDDLARGLLDLSALRADQRPPVLHFANQGGATRIELARVIFDCLAVEPQPELVPVAGATWPAAVMRPTDSRLSISRWISLGLPAPRPWGDAVRAGVDQWRSVRGAIS